MRTSSLEKSRRLFLERLECRYALNADDGLPDDPPADPPQTDDPPAVEGSDSGETGSDGSGDNQPPTDQPPTDQPPDANDVPPALITPATPPGPTGDDPTATVPLPPWPGYPGLPGPDATTEQLMSLTEEEFQAWLVQSGWIDGGYIGYTNPGSGTVAQPTGGITAPIDQAAIDELSALSDIFSMALTQYRVDLANTTGQDVGAGWVGNVFGHGPLCDEVFNGVNDYIYQQLTMNGPYAGLKFDDYSFATITAGGMLHPTTLSDHVYWGIVNKQTGDLEYFIDPWRNPMYSDLNPAAGDPNWNVVSITPWDLGTPVLSPPSWWDGGTPWLDGVNT